MDINLEKEKEELLAIGEKIRKAHFDLDSDALVSTFADSVIRVANGAISQISKDEMQRSYAGYFQDSVYHAMDDLEPPIIQISQDATLAWMITRTTVRVSHTDESGQEVDRNFIYAGIVTYEKQNGVWVRTANVATIA